MVAMSIIALVGWFLFGIVLGAALLAYVNFLVDRRLREILRRAAGEDDDWPAPPM